MLVSREENPTLTSIRVVSFRAIRSETFCYPDTDYVFEFFDKTPILEENL